MRVKTVRPNTIVDYVPDVGNNRKAKPEEQFRWKVRVNTHAEEQAFDEKMATNSSVKGKLSRKEIVDMMTERQAARFVENVKEVFNFTVVGEDGKEIAPRNGEELLDVLPRLDAQLAAEIINEVEESSTSIRYAERGKFESPPQ